MDQRSRGAFIRGYTRILNQAWSSEEFAQRLELEPQAVLTENGLPTVAGSRVRIERTYAGEPDLEVQVSLWELGHATGSYVLHVPATPQIYATELTDADLDDISGGAGSGCCSCNPCCCQE